MVAVKLDLIEGSDLGNGQTADYQIEQGSTYRELFLSVAGDRTAGTWEGEIRDNYLDQGGLLLATFSFETSIYNSETGESSVEPFMLSDVTGTIAPTNDIGSTALGIVNGGYYVYDIYYRTAPNDRKREFYGLVQVTPQATEDTP